LSDLRVKIAKERENVEIDVFMQAFFARAQLRHSSSKYTSVSKQRISLQGKYL